MNILILIIAVLPIYLIGLYVYNRDYEKEPKSLLTKLFIFGMLSCFPALILELFLGYVFGEEEYMNIYQLFMYSLIGIALVEEICKWFVVYKVSYNHKEFNHIYDIVVYSVFTSLGFACLENILYVYLGGIAIGIFRAVSAIPGHAAYAVIMANYLGRAKLAGISNDNSLENKNLLLSIIVPTFVHGIYDYFLFTGELIPLICFLIFLVVICKYSNNKIKKLSSVEENIS